ncbi:hypothetical protein [Pseudescherichia vulneris]|uniref:hypothetical protein n=1 Tax=Pseudescherichia vulneris TaxID=566 RepID=UPI0028D6CE1F|nr:hypothetical protein [Pseudescherichia vulneris]
MQWVNCSEALPEADKPVLVNDLSGEGVLIAWRSLWLDVSGKPTGQWEWEFQVEGLDSSDVKIRQWCAYPEPTIK